MRNFRYNSQNAPDASVRQPKWQQAGESRLPSEWTDKLCNTLKTSLTGYGTVKITDIANETFKVFKEML